MNATTLDAARDAKNHVMEVFGHLADVAGVGITRIDEGYGLKVNLRHAPPAGTCLPGEVNGVPVRVEVVGGVSRF